MNRAELVCMVVALASLALGFAAGLRLAGGYFKPLRARNAALAQERDDAEHAAWCARNDATRWKLRALRHGWKRDR